MTHEKRIKQEIADMRSHIDATPSSAQFMIGVTPGSLQFMIGLERQSYLSQVAETLLEAVPRLLALSFEDQTDAPPELYNLIDMLEVTLGVDLAEEL
jgi:hypothetical protein